MTAFNLETQIRGPIAVIGDVHGQVDKLKTVLDRLRFMPDFDQRWVIFIGDLVDRGPDPKLAIDIVLDFIDEHPRTTAIMGNHEFAMCSAMDWFSTTESLDWREKWIAFYDSETTFESYDATIGDSEELAEKIPIEHQEFLKNLPWCVEHPNLLFVHAGLDPNFPFATQLNILRLRDFTLGRPPWLCEKSFVGIDPPVDCPFTLVSGHVRVPEVVIRPRRILVDTTGGIEGNLSCVLMPERLVISSDPEERKPFRPDTDLAPSNTSGPNSWWNLWG